MRANPTRKPSISIVGPGRLGSALAVALNKAGFQIDELLTRGAGKSRGLAGQVGARAVSVENARLDSDLVWLTVGDSAIGQVAHELAANRGDWTNKTAFHSSGALASDELALLKTHGAAIASVHPLMTFSGTKPPSLVDVFFAVEGDARAVRRAEAIVRALGGVPMRVNPQHKPAYHAWASFGSPLLIALLAAAEQLAPAITSEQARLALAPLLQQTLDNYVAVGARAAFTGPLVRGDVGTIKKHLEVLRSMPVVRDVYVALATAALNLLPVQNAQEIRTVLDQGRGRRRGNRKQQ